MFPRGICNIKIIAHFTNIYLAVAAALHLAVFELFLDLIVGERAAPGEEEEHEPRPRDAVRQGAEQQRQPVARLLRVGPERPAQVELAAAVGAGSTYILNLHKNDKMLKIAN